MLFSEKSFENPCVGENEKDDTYTSCWEYLKPLCEGKSNPDVEEVVTNNFAIGYGGDALLVNKSDDVTLVNKTINQFSEAAETLLVMRLEFALHLKEQKKSLGLAVGIDLESNFVLKS